MSRPKPIMLLEHVDTKTYKTEQILDAIAIYAVFYKGKPINLRTCHHLVSYPPAKYKKTAFSNSGHAFNLADKLNKTFKTNDFGVYKLTAGELIIEDNE